MDELKSLETTRLRRPAARGALGRSFPYLVYGERAAKEGGRAGVRLPLGVLGMIALIGVVETAIALAAPRLRDPVSFSWVYAAEAAKHRAPGSGILCLGDSLAKDGLVSAVLTATTGVPTYNLSAPAAPAPMTECLFRRALDAGARPRAIVLELKPSLLAGGPRYRMRGWQEFLNFSETVSLIRSARNTSFAIEVVLGQILPSLRARYEIRETLRAGLQGKPPLSRLQNLVNGENWTINASANLAPRNLAFTGRVTEVEHQRTLSSRFKVHRVNDAAARRIVDLAAANHIRVFLLIPPFAPELHARRQVTGADRLRDAFVQSLQARSPGLTVLDARGSGYPSSVFVDPSHLDAQGAVALSRDVAGVLKHDLNTTAAPADRGRWIALPAFREPAANLALENVGQTRAARD